AWNARAVVASPEGGQKAVIARVRRNDSAPRRSRNPLHIRAGTAECRGDAGARERRRRSARHRSRFRGRPPDGGERTGKRSLRARDVADPFEEKPDWKTI